MTATWPTGGRQKAPDGTNGLEAAFWQRNPPNRPPGRFFFACPLFGDSEKVKFQP